MLGSYKNKGFERLIIKYEEKKNQPSTLMDLIPRGKSMLKQNILKQQKIFKDYLYFQINYSFC